MSEHVFKNLWICYVCLNFVDFVSKFINHVIKVLGLSNEVESRVIGSHAQANCKGWMKFC